MRNPDYRKRAEALEKMSDEELYRLFWDITDQIVRPLATNAENHTTPSIERSVLLRMGFNSIQADAFVKRCVAERCLGQGAGAILLSYARKMGVDYFKAQEILMGLQNWDNEIKKTSGQFSS
jgi:D-ornithine 4,5-aminomutase subunit alpha